MKHFLFTSESVSEGHPDKVADQISDAVLDLYFDRDPEAKVACETLVTTNRMIVAGEVHSTVKFNSEATAGSVKQIEDIWKSFASDNPLQYFCLINIRKFCNLSI